MQRPGLVVIWIRHLMPANVLAIPSGSRPLLIKRLLKLGQF